MRKRLLALLLVLSATLASLPVLTASDMLSNEADLVGDTCSDTTGTEETAFSEHLPTVSGETITYNGGWEAFAYHREYWGASGNGVRESYAIESRYKPLNTYLDITNSEGTCIPGYFQPEDSDLQNNYGAALCVNATGTIQAPVVGSFAVGNNCSAVLRYTVEKAGVVDIIWDKVGNVSANNAFRSKNFRYGVFVNSVMVWPVAGGTLYDTPALTVEGTGANDVATNVVAATGIRVSAGDRIEFICEQVLGTNAASPTWGGAGNVMFGRVRYTAVMTEPTASASIRVGATVSATAKVVVPNGACAVECGLYIDGVRTPGASAAILNGVAIKDIEKDAVTVQPYYITSAGTEMTGAVSTFTIAGLLRSVGGEQAEAVLNYAAAAQKYFRVSGSTLEYTPAEPSGEYSDALKLVFGNLENARVFPQEIALLLKDTVSFHFSVLGAEDGDVLRMTLGDQSATFALKDGTFEVSGIAIANWDTVYTFCIEDKSGKAVSSTFTYSVSSYYVRMKGKTEDADLVDIVNAMMRLYETV